MFWLSQTEADIVPGEDWLSEKETAVLSGLRFPKRRRDWLLGRWAAKQCLCAYLEIPGDPSSLSTLEVFAAADGAPEPFRNGVTLPLSLSLSHSADVGLAAVDAKAAMVGCDVERISPDILQFISDYITPAEAASVAGAPADRRAATATLIWCAKESALKALREGLRRDTRSIEVTLERARFVADWEGFRVTCSRSALVFHGWWRLNGGYAWALVSRERENKPQSR